jgi:hypothetical protein
MWPFDPIGRSSQVKATIMKMNRAQAEKWAKTRQMGRNRFVWTFGVALWGLTTGVWWSVAMAFDKGWNELPMFLILGLIGFPIGGYFFGQWMWKTSERNFRDDNQSA